MNIFFKLFILAFLNGLLAMISQIVLFREILSQIYANELILGSMIFSWLISGAIAGTYFYEKKLSQFSFKKILYLIAILPWVSIFLLIFLILFLRHIKFIIGIPFEIILNIWDAILIVIFTTFPLNFILTLNFISILEFLKRNNLNNYSGIFYLFESLGAVFIGIIYTLFLSGNFSDFTLVYWLGIITIAVVYVIFNNNDKESQTIKLILTFILVLYLIPLMLGKIEIIDEKSLNLPFSKNEILFNKRLKTGNFTITKRNDVISVYSNGIIKYIIPDNKVKEIIGWSILVKEKKENLLLINGGFTGYLNELLKIKNIKNIYYIENNNEEAKILRNFFEKDILDKENKVKYFFGDALFYIKNIINDKFDLIILNAEYPNTLYAARFYTKEFFHTLKSKLTEDGILVFLLKAGENYIDKNVLYPLASIYKTANTEFKNINLIATDSLIFLCSNSEIKISTEKLIKNIEKENYDNVILNKKYVESILKRNTEKIKDLILTTDVKINTFISPSVIFYSIISDLFYFKNSYNLIKISIVLLVLFITFFLAFKIEEFSKNKTAYLIMLSMSFISIIMEIIGIFLFQNFYGYIYQVVGILFSVFMLGIIIGCLISYVKFLNLRIIFILVLIINLIFYLFLNNINFLMILFYIFSGGFLTGFTYSFLTKNKNASVLYGSDLIGGAFGAFLVSIIFIPVLSIKTTIIFGILIILFIFFMEAKNE